METTLRFEAHVESLTQELPHVRLAEETSLPVAVRSVLLDVHDEDRLRAAACLQRLVLLRKRLEALGN